LSFDCQRILVINVTRIGDTLLTTPLMRKRNVYRGHVLSLTVDRYDFHVGLTVPPDPRDVRTCPSMSSLPRTSPYDSVERRVARTERQLLRTPDGTVCASVRWYVTDPDHHQRERAQQQLNELGKHVILAADPADPTTWLDPESALPAS
jgi:hypothetical protein